MILSRISQFLWRSSRLIRHHCLWRLSCSPVHIFCVLANFRNANFVILSEFLIWISLVLLNFFWCFLFLNCVSDKHHIIHTFQILNFIIQFPIFSYYTWETFSLTEISYIFFYFFLFIYLSIYYFLIYLLKLRLLHLCWSAAWVGVMKGWDMRKNHSM